MHIGGVILCGGKSSRMGYPKAMLPFGPELMLPRVVRLLSEVVGPIVVVAARDQELPPLPASIQVAYDERLERGPLEGLLAGLSALGNQIDAAYVTSCDVPLLQPSFVREMIARLGEHDIAVPVEEKYQHPLAAVYRTSVVPRIRDLLAHDQLRPVFLFDRASTVRVPVEELRRVDPDLQTLANLNHPADYWAALQAAGFEAPPEMRDRLAPHSPNA
jgi:molybdopterin-guanine dinucleotide biosynthesis protein A